MKENTLTSGNFVSLNIYIYIKGPFLMRIGSLKMASIIREHTNLMMQTIFGKSPGPTLSENLSGQNSQGEGEGAGLTSLTLWPILWLL